MHYEILAGQPGDGRKRALLSCLPLKGGVEDFPTVGTDLLLVPVKGPFVHNDGVLHRKSGHRLKGGGGGLRLHLLLPQAVWLVSLSLPTDA